MQAASQKGSDSGEGLPPDAELVVDDDADTVNPTPYTLHPTPSTLHPKPYTQNPTHYTLHPTPYTLHPRAVGNWLEAIEVLEGNVRASRGSDIPFEHVGVWLYRGTSPIRNSAPYSRTMPRAL